MRRAVLLLTVSLLAMVAVPSVAGASAGSPIGSFDGVTATAEGVRLFGWASDPDSSDPVTVHVYVDGAFAGSGHAQAPYPLTNFHGFYLDLPVTRGSHTVCVYALSIGPGDPTLLGCRSAFKPANPYGTVDSVEVSGAGPFLRGWAVDPDTYDPIEVRVYVDGAYAARGIADRPGLDVFLTTGWQGNHRYEIPLPLSPGPHQVCAYGINVGAGTNALLACRVLQRKVDPFGSLDFAAANAQTGNVNVHGWAIDPDNDVPISVHLWADGAPVAVRRASRVRPDIASAFPFRAAHGFAGAIPVPRSASTLCAYGINIGPGANRLLGCMAINRTGNPVGALSTSATACASGVIGTPSAVWAIDPDTAAPVDIAVYSHITGAPVFRRTAPANGPGPDPGFVSQFPQFGPNHWLLNCSHFSDLAYYAINAPGTPGTNQFLGAESSAFGFP